MKKGIKDGARSIMYMYVLLYSTYSVRASGVKCVSQLIKYGWAE